MALFVKKTEEDTEVANLYTFGLNKTKLFVGLGNPGEKYADNRHNVGFKALDTFAKQTGVESWREQKDQKAAIATGDVGGTRVILVKPLTFMNESGQAVRAVLDYYKLHVHDVVVVYDEADIDFGKIQIKQGGGTAGHNGLKSVLEHLPDEFWRIRVGVGPKKPEQMDLADFVLQDFRTSEQDKLKNILQEASSILGESTASDLYPDTRTII